MALVRGLRRLAVVSVWRRAASAAYYSTKPDESTIPTDQEQATGLEKKEMDSLLAGNEDPFNMNVQEGPWGTKTQPKIVPSMYEERLVGCICDDDTTFVNWMKLHKGPPQRCECGHWFQLVQGNPTDRKSVV